MHRFDLVDPRTLWKSYLLALAVLFVLITSSHFAASFFGGDSVRAAEDINMSGRQRMLSQRIMYFSALYKKNGYIEVEAKRGLEDALTLFVHSHEKLSSEAERPLPKAVRDIYFSEEGPGLDAFVRQFAETTQIVLTGPNDARLGAYLFMREVGPTTLLRDLNAAVDAFEQDARTQAFRGEMWGYLGYAMALLALLLEALLIFRPAHKTIVKAIDTLEENNEQVKQQEAEAFAALEDAEDAWVEAEHARKTSDAVLGRTKEKAAKLHKTLNVFMGGAGVLIERANGSNLTIEQRSQLSQVQRLTAASHDMVREFTDSFEDHEKEKQEKEIVFSPNDVFEAAFAAMAHYRSADPVWLTPIESDTLQPKVSGQPSRLLRAMIETIVLSLEVSGAANARIGLSVEKTNDPAVIEFRLLIDDGSAVSEGNSVSSNADLEETIKKSWASIFVSTATSVSVLASEKDVVDIYVRLPISLPVTRSVKSRRPVRSTRRELRK